MAIKVVPGSITEPYKIGQGDFAPNLVGQQFTDGTTLFTLGNFAITTSASPALSVVYNTGSFSESYTLETLNLTPEESLILSNQSINITLNLDPNNLDNYVYFGSFFEYIRTTIEQIILKWKGSLYVYFLLDDDPTRTPKNTVLNYSYDSFYDEATFLIPTLVVKNYYGLIYQQETSYDQNIEYGNISNLNNFYQNYQISNIFGDFSVIDYTGSTSNYNYINVKVKGNPWPNLIGIGFGSFNYHLRPKEEIVNKYFFSLLDEFESNVLNRLANPPYTMQVRVPSKTDEGSIYLTNLSITWPTTDGYNIDNNTPAFQTFVSSWLDVAKKMDEYKTDLVARRFVTASIIEFDTEGDGTDVYGRKVNKLLRIYGREFDQVKKYVDSISFGKTITYNKKDNSPDELIKILASELGLDVLLTFFENNLFDDTLPTNSSTEGYGNIQSVPFSGYSRNLSPKEIDTELWRRLVINAWWLFKSKGHRKVLEFFLNLFGIQECVVSLNEFIYIVKERINYDILTQVISEYLDLPTEEVADIFSGLPVDINGFPDIPSDTDNYYYQMNGFWYNGGNLSEIGNNPHLGPYDYGKMYFDRFRCFIQNFSGLTTGTTTFTTVDNLFTDYNGGNIEDGVPNYGDNFADIMNNNNMISPNATILLAGSSQNISYGDSNASLRITFNYGGSNCELTCPTELMNYYNGVIFITNTIPNTVLNLENTDDLFLTNQEELISATLINQQCCDSIGGFYLPISVSEPIGECPEQGQLIILDNGLVFGIQSQSCCTQQVVGQSVNWNGSQCFIANVNTNGIPEVFTMQELFSESTNPSAENFVCYWCPPTQVVCGEDYYNLVTQGNVLRVPTQGDLGGSDTTYGCKIGPVYTENNGVTYDILNYDPTVDALCPEFFDDQWTQVSPTEWSRGCCLAKIHTNTSGDGFGILIDNFNLCVGPFTVQNNIIYNNNQPINANCCQEQYVGQPVLWDGNNCVLANNSDNTSNCIINGISPQGVVLGINSQDCCTQQIVGQPVIWNGTSCNLISPDFCVITSVNEQNITDSQCCKSKGGYLSTDALGNKVCLQAIVNNSQCPTAYSFSDFTQDNTTYIEVLGFDGSTLTDVCCKEYQTNYDPNYYWDYNINKCLKLTSMVLKSCRNYLIESYMSVYLPQYHNGSNVGIYGLGERIKVTITKLIINGIDYASNAPSLPTTTIDPFVNDPDKWNSVLFIQKTLNYFNINNYKAQLPGKPINITTVPDTIGLIGNAFNEGYGYYIVYPENNNYEIELKVITQSLPSTGYLFNYKNNGSIITIENSVRDLPLDCKYDVQKTITPMNETCYKISNPLLGEEPTQCYPYTISTNTYI